MCRWSSQITSDYADCPLNPSHLVSPPPPLQLHPFLMLCPYHRPACYTAHGHTGVFQNNFLWHKLLALILRLTLFAFLFSHCFFPVHFLQHPLPKKCTLFFYQPTIQEIFFPALSFVTIFQFLNEPCQLFTCISKETLPGCTLGFIRGKGDMALNNCCLWLSLWIHQLSNTNSNYLNFRIC